MSSALAALQFIRPEDSRGSAQLVCVALEKRGLDAGVLLLTEATMMRRPGIAAATFSCRRKISDAAVS
jgi:hypothetical protein